MNLESILNEFERIVILKTIIFDVNLNFLGTDDLEKIDILAYDLNIDEFPEYNIEELYSDDPKVKLIYEKYQEFVMNKYEELKKCILNG